VFFYRFVDIYWALLWVSFSAGLKAMLSCTLSYRVLCMQYRPGCSLHNHLLAITPCQEQHREAGSGEDLGSASPDPFGSALYPAAPAHSDRRA